MVIHLKKLVWLFLTVTILVALSVLSVRLGVKQNRPLISMGGTIHSAAFNLHTVKATVDLSSSDYLYNRFRRPSNRPALENPYSFKSFEKSDDTPPLITQIFHIPSDVIKAYFGILRNASNMNGYSGGCGSIGNSLQPYPYAYELYTAAAQREMSLPQFVESFQGIGYMTLLKLYPAYISPGTPKSICYYMFETEAITGSSEKDETTYKRAGSYFVYHYGLITVESDSKYGWRISAIQYFPENFLCAPEHGWVYYSDCLVHYVYHDWYGLIDKIDKTEQKGDIISIYASGYGSRYRFDFVRLTNGYDILLHENIYKNGQLEETNLLKNQDQGLKLSALNPNLQVKSQE